MASSTITSPFTMKLERAGSTVTILCQGRLIAGVGGSLYSQVCTVLPNTKKLILDLTDVAYMDSMGLGTLVRIYVTTKSAGCELILKNLGKRVRELLGVAHVLNIFTVIGETGIKMGF